MKLDISLQAFDKWSHIKLHENPSSGSRVVPYGMTDGQMDRHDANSRLSQFFKNIHKTVKDQTFWAVVLLYTKGAGIIF